MQHAQRSTNGTARPRTIHDWLAEYGESHQHPTNKLIHWVAVPGIFWSIVALLWVIPMPEVLTPTAWLNLSALVLLVVIGFYSRLSAPLTIGMVLLTLACYVTVYILEQAMGAGGLFVIAVGVFVVLWVGQFVGHHLEGKKPSFFKDLQFLLIGPAWVMAFLFRKVGLSY